MVDIKVVWHKIPDTDSVLWAIIASDYLIKKWYNATSYIQWELNKETGFLLKLLKIKKPQIKTSFEPWTNICLVDHNEKSQSLDNIEELNVLWIIDHHKVNFECSTPINIRIDPIWSVATVLYKMYAESWFEINKEISTMMLACILSDTLFFKSATTTKEDIEIAKKLQKISQIENLENFAMAMFNAKSDLWDISIEELIKYDYKEFDFNGNKCGIWSIETTNPWYALGRKDEILKWLKQIKETNNLDFILLSVVDIIWEKNTSIVLDWEDSKTVSGAFNTNVNKNIADLKNRLSRKKQLAPELNNYFTK